jgi:uncharacterized membrane protein YkoI
MIAFLLALVIGAPAATTCKGSAELQAKAKITCEAARKSALGKLGGKGLRVRSAELEEEGGKLVYSFDVKRKGKPGVEEVQVDALTGEVASVKHESAKDEAKEKD